MPRGVVCTLVVNKIIFNESETSSIDRLVAPIAVVPNR